MILIPLILLLTFIENSRSLSDILLSNLDPKAGIVINSLTPSELLGYSLRYAGDFNNDGYDDFIIGAFGTKRVSSGIGAVYIIFGSKDGLSDLTVPSDLSANKGLVIYGPDLSDRFGYSVSFAGDVNNDEIDDIIIGSDYYEYGKGIAYVIYGSNNPPAIIDLAQGVFSSSQGFALVGSGPLDLLGSSVSWAGDVNSDQIDDIVVGASGVSGSKGAAYVIFGKKGTRGSITPGTWLDPADGFAILGTGTDNLGYSVSNAGDVDGDGIGDMIIGAYGQISYTGAVYIIYGKDGKTNTFATIDLSQTLSASQGFFVKGSTIGSQFGWLVGSAGDFNGDGKSDVIVGAFGENTSQGAVYVIFGGSKSTLSNIDLSSGRDPARIMKIKGASPGDALGMSVSGAGDVNGDDIDDIIMGAPQANGYAGMCYVIFGDKKPEPEIVLGAGLDPLKGFRIVGASPTGLLGGATSNAGDVNGDGMNDLIIGAYGVGGNAGAAYVLFTPLVCLETCLTCSTRWTCEVCKTGYGLDNSQCVICPAKSKLEKGVCSALAEPPLTPVTKVTKGMFDSGSTTSRIFTMGRSLSVGLGLIAKIIQNVRFLNISYPAETLDAFESYGTDLFELPIPEMLYESPETKELPSQYSRYDDLNSTFLENYWQTIMMILITLGGFLVIRLIQYLTRCYKKENILQIVLKNVGQTMANFFIIQIYSSLDDVIFYFVLDVGSTKMNSASAGISMSAAGLFLLIGGFLVIFHCWVLGKYQQAKKREELERFEDKFRIVGTLFEEFKDDSMIKQSFFGIMILRCIFLVLVILLLQPPWIQTSLLMGANLIFLGYLIYQRPFKSRFDEFSQYFSEFCVFAAYLSTLVLSILDYKQAGSLAVRNGFGKCIVLAGIVLCLGGFILQMIQTIGAIIEIIKFFRNYYLKGQVIPTPEEVNQDSENSNIMKNSANDLVELINISHRNQNKMIPLGLEKLQCSGNGLEVSFANNDRPPVIEKTSKKETEYTQRNPLENGDVEFGTLRTQGSSQYFRGPTSELVLNMGSEIPPQTNVKRRNKKFKKKERQPNLSVLHDHHHDVNL